MSIFLAAVLPGTAVPVDVDTVPVEVMAFLLSMAHDHGPGPWSVLVAEVGSDAAWSVLAAAQSAPWSHTELFERDVTPAPAGA